MGKKSTTKVEASPAVIKETKPLEKGKREAEDDLETKVNLKKPKKDQKEKSENQETMQGIADCLKRIEGKVDLLATKVDLLTKEADRQVKKVATMAASSSEDSSDNSSSDDEVAETKNPTVSAKNGFAKAKAESCSSSSDDSSSDEELAKKLAKVDEKEVMRASKVASSSDSHTQQRSTVEMICVKGFDSSLSEDDIKSALSNHFGSCGEIIRVFVPKDLETGAIKGFAYIDIKEDVKKALELNGSDMTGSELVVEKVIQTDNYRFGGAGGRNLNVGGRFAGGRCGGFRHCGRC